MCKYYLQHVGLDEHGLRLRNAVEKVIKVGKVIVIF